MRLCAFGASSLWVSGCGLSPAPDEKTETKDEKKTLSGGKTMKIAVVTSSPHPDTSSTSFHLAERFMAGARAAGHEVFRFDAAREETHPCLGCDECRMDGPCVFKDAIETKLMPKMLGADMIVLVTPLYYFGMSAQLKTVVDRFYSRTGRLHGKKSLLLATAYDSNSWTMEALTVHYKTLVRYMGWHDVGTVLGLGCGSRSLVEGSEFAKEAYKIGAGL